ncbi:MAG TPA: HoxN/HupN/NixA family nickel/cobalt transporter [Acidimicrobiales bacterium]|nr:HoxN/HupN/NixA family nickel/cobalt transporter [Acidimicrobiales bacterium]
MPTRASRLLAARHALTPSEWTRLGGMAAVVAGLLVLGFVLLLAAVPHHYHLSRTEVFGVGTGTLALTLGMRHAFDADHISAIDNTTRKLMAEGKRPVSVGFFFSLGHSTVVFTLAVLLNFGIRALDDQVRRSTSTLHAVTGIVGTSVSGTFLYVIAALNLVILASIVRAFRDMRAGRFDEVELERQLQQRGLLNRFFGPVARRVDAPWKMYPVGLLFGLGFDTATEVALLVLSGTAVSSGLPFWAILSLPILFAAGMSLFDTMDGCFMNFAYGWAFSRPIRKLYYNLVITGLSVAVAFVIGTVELLGLLGQEAHLGGSFWSTMANFNINAAGFVIVGLFVATWAVALAVWRVGRIEARWDAAILAATPLATEPGAPTAGEPVLEPPRASSAPGTGREAPV